MVRKTVKTGGGVKTVKTYKQNPEKRPFPASRLLETRATIEFVQFLQFVQFLLKSCFTPPVEKVCKQKIPACLYTPG